MTRLLWPLAVISAVGAVWAALSSHTTVPVAAVLPGESITTVVSYFPPLVGLALLLAAVAGVLVAVAVGRWR